jgi:hypothetical protein
LFLGFALRVLSFFFCFVSQKFIFLICFSFLLRVSIFCKKERSKMLKKKNISKNNSQPKEKRRCTIDTNSLLFCDERVFVIFLFFHFLLTFPFCFFPSWKKKTKETKSKKKKKKKKTTKFFS